MFSKKICDFRACDNSHVVDVQVIIGTPYPKVAADRSIIVGGYSNGCIAMWNYEYNTTVNLLIKIVL